MAVIYNDPTVTYDSGFVPFDPDSGGSITGLLAEAATMTGAVSETSSMTGDLTKTSTMTATITY